MTSDRNEPSKPLGRHCKTRPLTRSFRGFWAFRSLADAVLQQPSSGNNNFLLLRMLAASLVIFGHSFFLSPNACETCVDPLLKITGYASSHILGVQMFFFLSGFLVHKSLQTRKNLFGYLEARARRILPAYLVCITLMVFPFGAFFSQLPLDRYLQNPETFEYILGKWLPFRFFDRLPEVVFSNREHGVFINGSLWTIPLEASLYLLLGALGALRLLHSSGVSSASLLTLLLTILWILFGGHAEEPYRTSLQLSLFFFLGSFLYGIRHNVPLHPLLMMVLLFLAHNFRATSYAPYLSGLSLGYATLLIGYTRIRLLPNTIIDASYGIYLYGFPIQQAIAHFFPNVGPYRMSLMAIPLAWALGFLSFRHIESPFLLRSR